MTPTNPNRATAPAPFNGRLVVKKKKKKKQKATLKKPEYKKHPPSHPRCEKCG
jgi:hypothetical protein